MQDWSSELENRMRSGGVDNLRAIFMWSVMYTMIELINVYVCRIYSHISRDFNTIFKAQKYGVGLSANNRSLITQSWVLLHVCVIFCPRRVVMLLFTYQGKDWHSFTPSVLPNIDVKVGTVDKRMVSKGMWLSQYAPKGVKLLCITSS